MRRSIPDSYLGAPLNPELVSITDGEGSRARPRPSPRTATSSMTSRADDFVHGAQTYVFTYTLENVDAVLRRHRRRTSSTGTSTAPSGSRTSAASPRACRCRPTSPTRCTGAQACYVGYQGSATPARSCADAAADGTARSRHPPHPSSPYQTMTIAVGFEQGTFAAFDSSYLASPWGWLQALAGARSASARSSSPVVDAGAAPARRARAADDHRRVHAAAGHRRARERRAARAHDQGDPGRGARAGGGGQHPHRRGRAQALRRRQAQGAADRPVAGRRRRTDAAAAASSRPAAPGDEFEFGRTDTRFSSAAQNILKAREPGARRAAGCGARCPRSVRAWPVLAAIAAARARVLHRCSRSAASVDAARSRSCSSSARSSSLFIVIGAGLAQAAHRGRRRDARPPAGAQGVHRVGRGRPHPHAAVARRARSACRSTPTIRAQMLKLYEVLLPYAVVFGQEKQWAERARRALRSGRLARLVRRARAASAPRRSRRASARSRRASASSSSTSGGSSGGGSAGGGGGGGGGGGV